MDNFIKHKFDKVFNVSRIITIFYMEFSKDFYYDGEKHDFWELVYIDRGEMICTADKKQVVLKGGEITFHKPNEFHNLSGNKNTAPNVSIITFECKSKFMKYFEGKIFKLTSEEKSFLSMLFHEGLSAYSLVDNTKPLLQTLTKVKNSPFGSSQMTKNLLELFLIKLYRNKNSTHKNERFQYRFKDTSVPYEVKEIVDFLENNVYNKISTSDVAKSIGKSVSTIKNLFSKYEKGGIIKYYNYLKIEEAKKLIREEKYNFSQIAEMLKFDTPQYFSMTFKKFTHLSPQEYKNSIIK